MALTLEDSTATREAIIAVCRRMSETGLTQGTAGNVSVRVEDGVLVTPSGIPYDRLQPEMLPLIPREGAPSTESDYTPTTEWRFHQAVLAARPDMVAVVHAHPPHATAIAMQRRAIPACHYMVAAFGGSDIPLVDYALFGSSELARDIAGAMRDRTGCLLANHGAVTAGESLHRALWRMEELEALARMFQLAEASGTPVILSEGDIAEALVAFADYGPRAE